MSDTARFIGQPGVYPHALEDSGVSDRAFRLWCKLSRYAQMPHGAVPKRATLADELGCSTWSLDRARRELEAEGWVSVLQRVRVQGADGVEYRYLDEVRPDDDVLGQASNEYVVFFEQQPTAAPSSERSTADLEEDGLPWETSPPATDADPLCTGAHPPCAPTYNRSGSGSGSLKPLSTGDGSYVADPAPIPEPEPLTPAERGVLGAFMSAAADAGLARRAQTVPAGSEAELAARDGATRQDAEYAIAEAVGRDATLAYAVGVLRRLGRDRRAGRDPYRRGAAARRRPAPARGGLAPYEQPERSNPPRPPEPAR